MGRYRNDRLVRIAQEALCMHRVYEERYLVLMMTCVDSDKRYEPLIDKAQKSSEYWLEKYNRITDRLNAN